MEYCNCNKRKSEQDTYVSSKDITCCIHCFKKVMNCHNCMNCLTLKKHPWNNDKQFKGSISKDTGLYACIVDHEMGDNTRRGIIFEHDQGCCELFVDKNDKREIKYED